MFAFAPNRDSGSVRRHLRPDTKRRSALSMGCEWFDAEDRKAVKVKRREPIPVEE